MLDRSRRGRVGVRAPVDCRVVLGHDPRMRAPFRNVKLTGGGIAAVVGCGSAALHATFTKEPLTVAWTATAALVSAVLSLLVVMIAEHETRGRRLWLSLRHGVIVSAAGWMCLDARALFSAPQGSRDLQDLRFIVHMLVALPKVSVIAAAVGLAYFAVVERLHRSVALAGTR